MAEVSAVGQGAVALYTDSKSRNPKWRGVRLATALSCRSSEKEGIGTVSGTGGHDFPFKHVTCAEILCKPFFLLYTSVSHGNFWKVFPVSQV